MQIFICCKTLRKNYKIKLFFFFNLYVIYVLELTSKFFFFFFKICPEQIQLHTVHKQHTYTKKNIYHFMPASSNNEVKYFIKMINNRLTTKKKINVSNQFFISHGVVWKWKRTHYSCVDKFDSTF